MAKLRRPKNRLVQPRLRGLAGPFFQQIAPATLIHTPGNFIAGASAVTLVSIAVTPDAGTIDYGATQQFIATGTYSDTSTADITGDVTWDSSDDAVATITAGGLASGVYPGSAVISATLGAVSGNTNLEIFPTFALMFTADEDGGAYNINDLSTLFQDAAGTTPVTAVGDPVAHIADISGNGYNLTQGTGTAVGTLRQNALGAYYVECGSGDALYSAASFTLTVPHFAGCAIAASVNTSSPRFSAAKATNSHAGFNALFPNAYLQYGTLDPTYGTDKMTSALASISIGSPFVGTGIIATESVKVRLNGGKQWAAVTNVPAEFSVAALRINFNTTNGATAIASEARFYGGIVVNRAVSEAEELLMVKVLKKQCGIDLLERGTWDIFAIAGQSNGTGQGDAATSEAVTLGTAIEYQQEGLIKPLVDPTRHYANPGSATGAVSQTGSAWPAFANAYFAETGRKACIVGGCSSGIGLTTAAGWDVATTYVDYLSAKALAAKAFIEAAGGTAAIKGVIWVGGETDAGAAVAEATFEAGLASLLGKLKTAFDMAGLKMFMLSVDQQTDSALDDEYAIIRQAQIDAAAAVTDLYLAMPYQEFETDGLLEDTVHWNQTALNSAGAIAGAAVAGILYP